MLLEFFLLLIGVALLWLGAELLVRNSSAFATSLGISPVIVGLTVVSIGTSLPELVVSLIAAIQDSMGISIGNIIGSNIANIGLILGIGAIITPLKVQRSWVHKEVPAMIAFTILFTVFSYSGFQIGRLEGIILVILLLGFLFYLSRTSLNQMQEFKELQLAGAGPGEPVAFSRRLLYLFFSAVGAAILITGSKITVDSGQTLARHFGVSDEVVGLTLIAVGTSLPELATTIVGVLRKETDIVVGNVVGSNIFNLLMIGGVVSIIRPIPISHFLFNREFPFLLAFSILVWPIMRIRWNIHRYEGILLFVLYLVFVILIF